MKETRIKRILGVKKKEIKIPYKVFYLIETTGKYKYIVLSRTNWVEVGDVTNFATRKRQSKNLKTILDYWIKEILGIIDEDVQYYNKKRMLEAFKEF